MLLSPYLKTAVLLILTAAGCGKKHGNLPGLEKAKLPQDGEKIVAAQNDFAFHLLNQLLSVDPAQDNKLISPLSIYLDLSLAYNGARGKTQQGISTALGLGNLSTKLLNTTSKALVTGLPKEDVSVNLDIANSIWYRQGNLQPLPGFLTMGKNYYQAQVTGASFDASTVEEVNDWVSRNTHEKIKTILQRIDPADVMYLVNAVYFKGKWTNAFDSSATSARTFHSPGHGDVKVPFMSKEAKYNYLGTDSLQLIELPYGNGAFSMYIALPSAKINVEDWLKTLRADSFFSLLRSMDSSKVRLLLPRWKYAYQISDLKPMLSVMGMGEAFTKQADFTSMYPSEANLYISKALHKAYIEVNEKGTEAAAATSIGFTVTSMPLHPTPVMDVDRPFFYAIAEKTTGVIVFTGLVNNPVYQ